LRKGSLIVFVAYLINLFAIAEKTIKLSVFSFLQFSKAGFARNPSQGVSQWKTKVNQNGKIQFGYPPPPIHSVEKI